MSEEVKQPRKRKRIKRGTAVLVFKWPKPKKKAHNGKQATI